MSNKHSCPSYPEAIFRFRLYTPMALKELQYGELFFAARDELNDPYDTQSSAFFESDIDKYERLILNFLGQQIGTLDIFSKYKDAIDIKSIASFLCKDELFYDDLKLLLSSQGFASKVFEAFNKPEIEHAGQLAFIFTTSFRYYFYKHIERPCYIVSFSQNNCNPVMWSHYSNHHKGFCMCFSIPENKFVIKNHLNKKKHIGERLLEKVYYDTNSVSTPGFYGFPVEVNGHDISQEEKDQYWLKVRESYLRKFQSWSYEEEVRLVDDSDWLYTKYGDNGAVNRPIIERIAYYDQKQFTGIIFGAKMKEGDRQEIRNTIIQMRTKLYNEEGILPLFIFYEATQNAKNFLMNINPLYGLSTLNEYFQISELETKQKEYQKLMENAKRSNNRESV